MSDKTTLDINKIKLQINNSSEIESNREINSPCNYDSNNNQLGKYQSFLNKDANLSPLPESLPSSALTFQSNQKDKIQSKSLKKSENSKVNLKSKLSSHSNFDLGYHEAILSSDLFEGSTPQENFIKNSDTTQYSKSSNKKQIKQLSSFSLGSNSQKSSNWSRLKSR